MKRRFLGLSLLFGSLALCQEYQLNGKVGDFQLANLDGKSVPFSALKGDTTVVVFISTQCPVSNAYNERMNALYKEYSAKGVKWVFVNANASEPADVVRAHAKSAGFDFPVYKDPDNKAADKFDARVTPEAYVIDKTGTMVYHGSIDDSQNEARIKTRGLKLAMDAVMNNQVVQISNTKAFGCTIKRKRAS